MQIAIILRKIWSGSTVISMFSEHITILIFDNSNVNNDKWIFFCKLFKMIKFFFLILLREATLTSKVAPTNRNSSAFLLHTFQKSQIFLPHPAERSHFEIKSCSYNRKFSQVELFSIFSQTFLELIFATKIKTMLLKQSGVLFTSCQKNIAYIIYGSEHSKYCSQINEYWL